MLGRQDGGGDSFAALRDAAVSEDPCGAMSGQTERLVFEVFHKVISAPEAVIFSAALLLCFVGVSMATNGLFGVTVMLIFAVFGVLMHSFGYSVVIFIIAFFLGPQFEKSLAQAIALLNGNILNIYTSPVAVALLVLSVVWIFWFLSKRTNEVADTTNLGVPDGETLDQKDP